jgi:pyruvate dehydrogenase E2 component (dihydrolipoamide acetyltransferase)
MGEIRLPQAGMGMTDGVITVWHKAVGDAVQKGELLCEIEAAKTVLAMEAPETGVLTRIIAKIGETTQVNEVIAEIAVIENSPAPAQPTQATAAPQAAILTSAQSQTTTAEPGVQVEARARRAAKDLDVNLAAVHGSGPGGRITFEDVQGHARQSRALAAAQITTVANLVAAAPYTEVPHSTSRRTMARRLTESKQQAPHFYISTHCEIDKLLRVRAELNETSPIRLSLNDFVVRAVALALKEVPDANVSWGETAMRRYRQVDVSVAVATPRGLLTPIVRYADSKSVAQIAPEIKALARRASEGKLNSDEYEGGNITVSNLGMYGVEQFNAILNAPQACIFAVGSATEQPVVHSGRIEVATRFSVTLSVDHRAIDGALGAQLLAAFKRLIEDPVTLRA